MLTELVVAYVETLHREFCSYCMYGLSDYRDKQRLFP